MASVQAAINDRPEGDQIRSRPCPVCYLCGTRGEVLHQGLRDGLFGAPGTWNFRRCPNLECGLIWLDPVPWEEDIARAYATYYTHQEKALSESVLSAGRLPKSVLAAVYRFFLRLILVDREQKQLACMYLNKTSPGRLLEVGCGDGSRLARLRG